jgi:hypothetical protein
MGLVVLSVFALAFVACGDSDSGEPSGPGPGQGQASGPVPQSISIATQPTGGGPGGAAVLEGQDIVLTGIVLNVRDSENKTTQVSDITKMNVVPSIYIYGYGDYTLFYTDKNRTVQTTITFPNVRKLITLAVTGQMYKQEYLIDELPEYNGLTVYGVYSDDPADNNGKLYPWDTPANRETQAKFYRRPINLDITNPYHHWAWVWNARPSASAPGSFDPNDNPGVLISIGTYGYIESKIQGAGNLPPPAITGYTGDILAGTRIEIAKLHQVREIEVAGTWDTIFYDDPTLISAVTSPDELAARMAKWADKLLNADVKVTYTNGAVRNYDLKTLESMAYAYADSLNNLGWGGTWANLEIFPVSRAGFKIDVTKDNKLVLSDVENQRTTENFSWLKYYNNEDKYDGSGNNPEGDSYGAIIGDGGWAQWAQLGMGYTRMGFWWRGIGADLRATAPNPVVVPVYNRPLSITVTQKGDEPFTPFVRMVGNDLVYRKPEGMQDYLNKVSIAVRYIRQGGTESDYKDRTDLFGDIASGVCRDFVIMPSVGYAYTDSADIAAIPLFEKQVPSLYSDTIFNWEDVAPARNAANAWRYDLNGRWARLYEDDNTLELYNYDNLLNTSFLTKAYSESFQNRGRTVRGRIFYTGWAGDPGNTRTVNSGSGPMVAPIGYANNPTP